MIHSSFSARATSKERYLKGLVEGKPNLSAITIHPEENFLVASASTGGHWPHTLPGINNPEALCGLGLLLVTIVGLAFALRAAQKTRKKYRMWEKADQERICGLLHDQHQLDAELDAAYCSAAAFLKQYALASDKPGDGHAQVRYYVALLLGGPVYGEDHTSKDCYPELLTDRPELKFLLRRMSNAELCAYANRITRGSSPEATLLEGLRKNGKPLRECSYQEVSTLVGPEAAYQFQKLSEATFAEAKVCGSER